MLHDLHCGVVRKAGELPFSAVFTACVGGVRLHLDPENEETYIEADLDCEERAMSFVLSLVRRHGFELLDEDECPGVSFIERDRLRVYLVPVPPRRLSLIRAG